MFVPHQANQRIIDHAARRLGLIRGPGASRTSTDTATRRPRSIPICLDEAHRSGRIKAGRHVLMTDSAAASSWGACVMEWALPLTKEDEMSKVAFCFPGQGAQEVGMGRAMAEAFP